MRKRIVVLGTILMCAGVLVVGCGQGGDGGGGKKIEAKTVARAIEDGATKYFPAQTKCPVCGSWKLHPDHHVDLDEGRVYFDKAECVEKFNQNQSKYLQKMKKRRQEAEKMKMPRKK